MESSSWEAETLHYARRPAAGRAPVVVRGDLSAATMRAGQHLITAEHELLHLAEAVLAVSKFAATDLAVAYRLPPPMVVANGVDRERFRPGPTTPPTGGEHITLNSGATAATTRLLAGADVPLSPWSDPGGGRHRLVWVGKTTPMKGWDRLERLVTELDDLVHITVLLAMPQHCRPSPCPVRRTA